MQVRNDRMLSKQMRTHRVSEEIAKSRMLKLLGFVIQVFCVLG